MNPTSADVRMTNRISSSLLNSGKPRSRLSSSSANTRVATENPSVEICPALERSLSLTNKGPILLLTGYQSPAAIRRSSARYAGDLDSAALLRHAAAAIMCSRGCTVQWGGDW